MLGSAFVFFMKDKMPERVQKSLLGFASGVMVAASVWSLLIPAMEMEADSGKWSVIPAVAGFLLGIFFLLALDELTPHLHVGSDTPEGPRSRLSRTAMLALAVTLHNLPEGMAVGVVFAGAEQGSAGLSVASAVAISLGIAIQNIPEGAIISMPMRTEGNSKWRSFLIGSLSGAVEPVGAIAVLLLASLLMPFMPYMLEPCSTLWSRNSFPRPLTVSTPISVNLPTKVAGFTEQSRRVCRVDEVFWHYPSLFFPLTWP